MSRPSSKAIYSKFPLHPLSLALRMLPTPHCLGLTWAFSPPPTLSPRSAPERVLAQPGLRARLPAAPGGGE